MASLLLERVFDEGMNLKRIAFLAVVFCFCAFAQSPLDLTRTLLNQWIQTRKLIAELRSDWRSEREVIDQSIAAFERELQTLSKQETQVDAGSNQTEKELKSVGEERAALRRANDALRKSVAKLEARIRQLAPGFPSPLMETMAPLFNRIPENPAETKWGLSVRLQNIVGILNEIDKFNSSLTLVSELRKSETGAELQTRVLYVGLSQAYFIDKTGAFCGYGISSKEGWKWTAQPDLAPMISQAIRIYENAEPASFVSLPVNVK